MSFALYSPEDTVMLPNLPSKKSPPPPPWPSKKKDDLYSFDFLGIQSPWNAKLDSIQDLWREEQVERRPSLSSSVSSLDDQVDDEDDFCPFWPSGASPLRPLRPMDFNKFNKYSHRRHSAGVVAAGEENGNSRLMQQRGTRPTDLIGYITESNNKSTNTSSTAAAAARRHSLAGVLDQALLDDIDSYFSRRRDVSMGGEQDLGKGVPVQRLGDTKLYKVEFKEGRTDLFYYNVNENEHKDDVSALRVGQYVLVEGDRGHDLGCIVADDVNISSLRKEAVVRRVFRPATDLEISSLRFKEGDEEKALALCKARVKEYGLPMQVVRAEYQWDRRKLTFFFESDTRVDFRDLVRDLFKTYKTRIWMCSLNSACNSITQQEQA